VASSGVDPAGVSGEQTDRDSILRASLGGSPGRAADCPPQPDREKQAVFAERRCSVPRLRDGMAASGVNSTFWWMGSRR